MSAQAKISGGVGFCCERRGQTIILFIFGRTLMRFLRSVPFVEKLFTLHGISYM